jgi:hypothetical protein
LDQCGVRQQENLSPFLFSLFLNDIDTFLENENITGLQTISDEIENNLDIYLKLFILLYAEDTVLLAETANDLQAQPSSFGHCVVCVLSFGDKTQTTQWPKEEVQTTQWPKDKTQTTQWPKDKTQTTQWPKEEG